MSCLQVIAALSDHPLVSVSKQFLWRELESRQLKRRHHKLQLRLVPVTVSQQIIRAFHTALSPDLKAFLEPNFHTGTIRAK